MAKEKVFIVLSHKHSLKKRTKNEWEVTETVEFVNQLRNRHINSSSAIGDYLNRTMMTGTAVGMGDYDKFESYVRQKYSKQLGELDAAYREAQVAPAVTDNTETEVFADAFGNVRARTVFDL